MSCIKKRWYVTKRAITFLLMLSLTFTLGNTQVLAEVIEDVVESEAESEIAPVREAEDIFDYGESNSRSNTVFSGATVEISNLEELKRLSLKVAQGDAAYIDADCILTGNITINGEFIPIGTITNPFKGSFTGQDIYAITIGSNSVNYSGLFGHINNADLKDITIKGGNIKITSGSYGAVLVQKAINSSITECKVKSNINIIVRPVSAPSNPSSGEAGGLVAHFESEAGDSKGYIEDCYIEGNVNIAVDSAYGGRAGGLVGSFKSQSSESDKGYIRNCYIKGNVIVMNEAVERNVYAGGLIGDYDNSGSGGGKVLSGLLITGNTTVSAETTTGSRAESGGLIGYFLNTPTETTVEDCYIKGIVTVNANSNDGLQTNAGGLFGYYNISKNTLNNCSITGTVKIQSTNGRTTSSAGNTNAGGLFGELLVENLGVNENDLWLEMSNCKIKGDVEVRASAQSGRCNANAGGLAGEFFGNSSTGNVKSIWTNSGVDGSVKIIATADSQRGDSNAGGIVGDFFNRSRSATSKFNGCYVNGAVNVETVNKTTIDSRPSNAGGLFGDLLAEGTSGVSTSIENCYITTNGTISIKSTSLESIANAGGIMGYAFDQKMAGDGSTIESGIKNSYLSTSQSINIIAKGSTSSAGGLTGLLEVGRSNSRYQVSNSYVMGKTIVSSEKTGSGGNAFSASGGLIGSSMVPLTLKDSYSTGKITATNYGGGIVGFASEEILIKDSIALNSEVTTIAESSYTGGTLGYSKITPIIDTVSVWSKGKLKKSPGIQGITDLALINTLNGSLLTEAELEQPLQWPAAFQNTLMWSHRAKMVPVFLKEESKTVSVRTLLGLSSGGGTSGGTGGSGGSSGGGSGGGGSKGSSSTTIKNAVTWKQNDAGWWLVRADGSYPTNQWAEVKGVWYHFDPAGYMNVGWRFVNQEWYYLRNDGGMIANDWVFINDKWYFMSGSGAMKFGWQEWKGSWHYLNTPNGEMAVGTTTPDGYTVDEHGVYR